MGAGGEGGAVGSMSQPGQATRGGLARWIDRQKHGPFSSLSWGEVGGEGRGGGMAVIWSTCSAGCSRWSRSLQSFIKSSSSMV